MFQVKVEWDVKSSTIPSDSKKLTLTLNYEQKSGIGGDDSELVASDYLLKNALETDITNPGNGLYPIDHNSEVTTSDTPREYRYLGANPNNYVSFGTYTKNEEYYVLQYTSSMNWGGKKTLYFTTEESCQNYITTISWETPEVIEKCTLKTHSSGEPILWRIIGIFDGKLKLVKNDHVSENGTSSQYLNDQDTILIYDDLNSRDWNNASLNKYLNETYYQNFTSENQKKIEATNWYLGSVLEDDIRNGSVQKVYEQEHDATSGYTPWLGKIGLIHYTDYTLATSGSSDVSRPTCLASGDDAWSGIGKSDAADRIDGCRDNSWLYGVGQTWTLNPIDGLGIIQVNGSSIYAPQSSYAYVYPSFYLNSNVQIVGGTGTLGDPYIIS